MDLRQAAEPVTVERLVVRSPKQIDRVHNVSGTIKKKEIALLQTTLARALDGGGSPLRYNNYLLLLVVVSSTGWVSGHTALAIPATAKRPDTPSKNARLPRCERGV